MTRVLGFILFTSLYLNTTLAQQSEYFSSCGTEILHEQLLFQNPDLLQKLDSIETAYVQYMERHAKSTQLLSAAQTDTLITLPVVIHIIHDNGPENISDAQAIQGLQDLNDAFRNRGYYDPQSGVDTYIEFCLAKRTPNGEETNGIIRHESSLTDMSTHHRYDNIVDLATWNTSEYINIRLVRNPCIYGNCGIAGFSTYPSASGQKNDGLVIGARFFGSSKVNGVVITHEMGHFLGLRHTFYKGCENKNCLEDGDKVCDTPPDNSTAGASCDFDVNSCTTDEDDPSPNNPYRSPSLGGLGDQADHRKNYMDYSSYSCYDQFTKGQKDRMRFFINGSRNILLQSKACLQPCEDDPVANFSVSRDSIEAGETINITNLSSNANQYRWYLNNRLISQSQDTTLQFLTEGVYTLRLETWNGDIACDVDTMEIRIKVVCPVKADFDYTINGDWLVFTNNSKNETQLEWSVKKTDGNKLYSSDQQKDSFKIVGQQYIQLCLTANNDYCQQVYCEYIKLIGDGIEICNNQIDDDGDGYVDLFDKDCECTENAYQAVCPIDCEYIPDSFPEIKMKLKWQSEIIANKGGQISNIVTGDINNDGLIEVLTKKSIDIYKGRYPAFNNYICIISGNSGATKNEFKYTKDSVSSLSNLFISIADINRDRKAELIFQVYDSVKSYSNTGSLITNYELSNIKKGGQNFLNIADFNGDGTPEIYKNATIYNSLNGKILCESKESIGCANYNFNWCFKAQSIASDLLPSPGLELAAGNKVYAIELTNLNDTIGNRMTSITADTPVLDGYTSIGDINGDGELDIISFKNNVNNDGGIWIWDPRTGAVIASKNGSLFPIQGGAPFVSDVDGDCTPEIGIAFSYELRVYQYNGTKELELLYSIPTSDQSGFTGITMFDFNQDGKNELVYRDETDLRIIEGATGITLASTPMKSGTAHESPILADVDNDGQAEILVNGYLKNEDEQRIFCFESAGAPWAPARSVWNQPGYHVTNVNDDLTIPRYPQNQAKALEGADSCLRETCATPYNAFMAQATYRTQSGCVQFPAVDLSLEVLDYECTPDSLFFTIVLDNYSDTEYTGDSIHIATYSDYPIDSSNLVQINSISLQSDTGGMKFPDTIRIAYPVSSWNKLYFIINDIGTGASAYNHHITGIVECDYENNLDSVDLAFELLSINLGPDISKCRNEVITLNAGSGFKSYLWSDGTTDSVYSSSFEGVHFVEAMDQCGRVYTDTVEFIIDPITEVDLGPDTVICNSSSFTLTASNGNPSDSLTYDEVRWFPRGNVSCDSCNTISISSDTAFTLYVLARKDNCFSTDTLNIEFKELDTLFESAQICEGNSLNYRDSTLSRTGQYGFRLNECDSMVILDLDVLKNDTSFLERSICEGDSIYFDGRWERSTGIYSTTLQNIEGCDSLVQLDLQLVNTIEQYDTVRVCEGDSVYLFNEWIKDESSLNQTFVSSAGCDSIQYYQVLLDPLPSIDLSYDVCQGDSIQIGNSWITGEGSHTLRVENLSGCDSIYNVEITEIPIYRTLDSVVLCEGDSIWLFDNWYHEEGKYESIHQSQYECDSIHTTVVQLIENPPPPETEINCNELVILASINANTSWSILWENGDTSKQTTFRDRDSTFVKLMAEPDCNVQYTLQLPLLPDPHNLPTFRDTTIDRDGTIEILLDLDPAHWNIQWSPDEIFSCDTCLSTQIQVRQNATVEASFIHSSGCTYRHSFNIAVSEGPGTFIPNTFTPNADGINDVFELLGDQFRVLNMKIFDRWGNLVFEARDGFTGWDGTYNGQKAQSGTYIYYFELLNEEGEVKTYTGDITLLR